MKISDVVKQLAKTLPEFTNLFSDTAEVISLTMSGSTVTATTANAHNFSAGKGVCITGAKTPITITAFSRTGSLGTLTTSVIHDVTLNVPGAVEVIGADQNEYNGIFKVIDVPNSTTIVVEMDDTGPTTATGSMLLLNGSSSYQSYNGWHEILATPTATTFTFALAGIPVLPDALGDIVAHSALRISGLVSVEEIESAYTAQAPEDYWLFVTIEDVIASKDRNILSDATSNIQRQQYFRQQAIQSISLHVVIPTAQQQIAGRQARDSAEDLFSAICKAVLFYTFPSGLYAANKNALQFVSHGTEQYNGSYYIHGYNFEQVLDLQFEDSYGYSDDVALREIDLSMATDVDTQIEKMTALINY